MMTSEVEALKTNEFLRRRKLRIQQVREQSKDIAKKIRLRASAEKFRHLVDLDSTKAKEYFDKQDTLIKKLELLHAKSLASVGASHKEAQESAKDNKPEKVDLSKQRAREAAAILRQKRQEKLDEQKRKLDRKLQARETANEISREKLSSNKISKSTSKPLDEAGQAVPSTSTEAVPDQNPSTELPIENVDVLKTDMATQWDFDTVPDEWDPHIPQLTLPKDDTPVQSATRNPESQRSKRTNRFTVSDENPESRRSKRMNLFAISDEMPSSLRGSRISIKPSSIADKSSLTLVSDYLKNRDLRLRDYSAAGSSKKPNEDLQTIKQTIQRSRISKNEGIHSNSVRVADTQVVPVPSWQAETNNTLCYCQFDKRKGYSERKSYIPDNCAQYKTTHTISSAKPPSPNPVLRGPSPFKRNKVCMGSFSVKSCKKDKSKESAESNLAKKSSVTTYNHSTRDIRDMPCGDRNLVIRDQNDDDDAYLQAMKETSSENVTKAKENHNKSQDSRSKVAMTKLNIEKEYRDTMAFLNSLPKDSSKLVKGAYKDSSQQRDQKELREKKLQHEFRKIEKECRRHPHHSNKFKTPSLQPQQRNSSDDDFEVKDSQYSWMPVPESDGGLAIHIIPTKVKESKCGNAVRFSKIDSYHEYRSRHKHTPPTKDTCEGEKHKVEKSPSTEHSSQETSNSSESESSSVHKLHLKESKSKRKKDDQLSDAERIILYKILDSKSFKNKEKIKKKISKAFSGVAKSLSFETKESTSQKGDEKEPQNLDCGDVPENKNYEQVKYQEVESHRGQREQARLSIGQVTEGVYKAVSETGENIPQMHDAYTKPLTFPNNNKSNRSQPTDNIGQEDCKNEMGDVNTNGKPLQTASSSSFKTAANDKVGNPGAEDNILPIVNDKELNKFYIGASGLFKDEAYEVIIQLKKSDKVKPNEESKSTNQNHAGTKAVQQQETSIGTNPSELNTQVTTNTSDKNVGTVDEDLHENKKRDTCLVDKSVNVPFTERFIIPSVSKAGHSVSVQTTLDSADTRPGLFRIDSSTSTAYMSPPEHVLPHALRANQNEYCYFYHSRKTGPRVNNEIDDYLTSLPSPSKSTPKKQAVRHTPRSPKMNKPTLRRNLKTPPNTARSTLSGYSHFHDLPRRDKKSASFPRTKSNHKCVKRRSGKARKVAALPTKMRKCISKSNPADEKCDLNPIIKWYVDKLLSINKEGLRTLEILNQDCSYVTTPGSSIVCEQSRNEEKGEEILEAKISLEQIKMDMAEKIMKDFKLHGTLDQNDDGDRRARGKAFSKFSLHLPRKKTLHKVKSLNISKNMQPKKRVNSHCDLLVSDFSNCSKEAPTVSHAQDKPVDLKPFVYKTSSSAKESCDSEIKRKTSSFSTKSLRDNKRTKHRESNDSQEELIKSWEPNPSNIATKSCIPITTSTQTSATMDEEIKYIKLAEDKIQNMEKIADLTEKCTKRLSNLAKVLDEVRKTKLSYNNIPDPNSDTDLPQEEKLGQKEEKQNPEPVRNKVSISPSDTDQSSEQTSNTQCGIFHYEPIVDIKQKSTSPQKESVSPTSNGIEEINSSTSAFVSFLKDIPKPKAFKSPTKHQVISQIRSPKKGNAEQASIKNRTKPPPALSKRCAEIVNPHELSTVIEVDSPISAKHKSQSVRLDPKKQVSDLTEFTPIDHSKQKNASERAKSNHPDILPSNKSKKTYDLNENKRNGQMMDIKQFNDIMLKPFISIQEYAKQCNITTIEEGSNLENIVEDVLNEELSSLHSDGSLPDVIAELLKRNIITEPFKFDTTSNVNTTSSDSTLSVLALSKMRNNKNDRNSMCFKKDNFGESSDSLSISSNPDLENAFRNLGIGWASSTLKKTKEHLALSSSSNTSSSSLPQFKCKTLNNNEFPELITESLTNVSTASGKNRLSVKTKPAVQQTSMATSMTVKQFLTDELAKRITFGEKSHNDESEEFVSLQQTKIPEELKSKRNNISDERSIESNPRARTSTPVQIFKSMTYHSSSSSNNGLFSNADDLSSVKGTSNSLRNNSTSEKDDLTIPSFSLRSRKAPSDCSKSDN